MKILEIFKKDNLIENVRTLGGYLGECLKDKLRDHPNVGDIRGKGFF